MFWPGASSCDFYKVTKDLNINPTKNQHLHHHLSGRDALDEPNNGRSEHLFFSKGFTINIYGLKIELNLLTYLFYLFIFRRFKCTTIIIKELLLNLLHFIFTSIAIFIKP